MMGHKICFYGEMGLIFHKLSQLPHLIWNTGYYFSGVGVIGGYMNRTRKLDKSVIHFGNVFWFSSFSDNKRQARHILQFVTVILRKSLLRPCGANAKDLCMEMKQNLFRL